MDGKVKIKYDPILSTKVEINPWMERTEEGEHGSISTKVEINPWMERWKTGSEHLDLQKQKLIHGWKELNGRHALESTKVEINPWMESTNRPQT